jgi:hypothetical protein
MAARPGYPPAAGPPDVCGVAGAITPRMSRPSASELLETPGALLTRSHLRELGLGRSAIDAVFRELDVVLFPGSSRPMIRREDYLELLERSTYGEGRVRLTSRGSGCLGHSRDNAVHDIGNAVSD